MEDTGTAAPVVWTGPAARSLDPACVPVPSGLVSWWRGEGNADDFAGANPGTLQGTAAFASGKIGTAFALDGGGFILVADDPSLDLTGEFALEFWFNFTYAPTFLSMLGKRPATGVANYGVNMNPAVLGLGLYYNDPNVTGGDDYDFARSPYEALRLFPVPTAGAFHHFAGTYRQSGSQIELRMYVDGSSYDPARCRAIWPTPSMMTAWQSALRPRPIWRRSRA